MSALSPKLRSLASPEGSRVAFWCPGCGAAHQVRVEGPGHPRWEWDGNAEAPTFSPSVLVRQDHADGVRICHSFVRAGRIEFLGDCTHDLAGQTVPLPGWTGQGGEA